MKIPCFLDYILNVKDLSIIEAEQQHRNYNCSLLYFSMLGNDKHLQQSY